MSGDELADGLPSRRVPRPVAVVLIVVVVGVLIGLKVVQGPTVPVAARPSTTAKPSPSVSAWPAGSVTLLPPLCGGTAAQPACPTATPEGVYESQLTGLNLEHPFTFRLGAGWSSTPVGYSNGFDFAGTPPATGFSLLLSPRPGNGDPGATADAFALASAVSGDPAVTSSPLVRSVLDGSTAWQVDVRLRPGQPTADDCRLAQPCHAIAYQYVSLLQRGRDVAAGAFADHSVRLIFIDLPRQQTALVWIWDTRQLAAVGDVIDSIHFCTTDQGCPTVSNPYGAQPTVTPQP